MATETTVCFYQRQTAILFLVCLAIGSCPLLHMSKNTSNVTICLKLECICFILCESKINGVSFCWRFSERTSCHWPTWHSTRQARGKVSLFFLTFSNQKKKKRFLRSSQVVQLVTDRMCPSLGFPDSGGYRGVRPALAPTGKLEFPLCVCVILCERH